MDNDAYSAGQKVGSYLADAIKRMQGVQIKIVFDSAFPDAGVPYTTCTEVEPPEPEGPFVESTAIVIDESVKALPAPREDVASC